MVVITVGEQERVQALVRLAVRNKHTLAFWMAPQLQMNFRDIPLPRIKQHYCRKCFFFLSSAAVQLFHQRC